MAPTKLEHKSALDFRHGQLALARQIEKFLDAWKDEKYCKAHELTIVCSCAYDIVPQMPRPRGLPLYKWDSRNSVIGVLETLAENLRKAAKVDPR